MPSNVYIAVRMHMHGRMHGHMHGLKHTQACSEHVEMLRCNYLAMHRVRYMAGLWWSQGSARQAVTWVMCVTRSSIMSAVTSILITARSSLMSLRHANHCQCASGAACKSVWSIIGLQKILSSAALVGQVAAHSAPSGAE